MPPNVLFPRDIRLGLIGDDVVGHKRAISRAMPDVYPWRQFSNYAGPYFIHAINEFQKAHGLTPASKIGQRSHAVLEQTHAENKPHEWAFDQYAIDLCKKYYYEHHKTPEERIRETIVSAAFYWYAHRYNIAYSQTRPFQKCKPPQVPSRWDCSAFVTNCWYAANAPDPNGRKYDGEGYTGTLITNGERVSSIFKLMPGDLIFYGYSPQRPGFRLGDPTHVAIYVGVFNDNHMIVSNGSYPMHYTYYNYRAVNQYRHYDVGV